MEKLPETWAEAGPLIEQYRIGVRPSENYWAAYRMYASTKTFSGKTALEAAMLCYAAIKASEPR